MPPWLLVNVLRALAAIAKAAGRGARVLVDQAKRQAREEKGIPVRLATLLAARCLVAIADGALWAIDKALP